MHEHLMKLFLHFHDSYREKNSAMHEKI